MLFHDLISGDELLADAAALLTNRLELVDKGLVELELFCVETCGGGTGLRKHICTVHGRDVALRDEQLGRRVEALDEALSRALGVRVAAFSDVVVSARSTRLSWRLSRWLDGRSHSRHGRSSLRSRFLSSATAWWRWSA